MNTTDRGKTVFSHFKPRKTGETKTRDKDRKKETTTVIISLKKRENEKTEEEEERANDTN